MRRAVAAAVFVGLLAWLLVPPAALGQLPPSANVVLGEKKVAQLPSGTLAWRVETFPTKAAADAAAGPTSLSGE